MNKILKLGSAILGSMLMAGGMFAQDAAAPAPTGDNTTASQPAQGPGKGLGLTAEQRQQMRELHATEMDKAAIIRHDTKLTDAQKQEQIKALRADTRKQMKSILTPEQQAKVQQRMAAGHQRMAKLNLTEDQKTKLKSIRTTARTDRQNVLNDASLSQDQKAAKLKAIRENTHSQMKTVLTPEQFEQMQEMQMGPMHRHGGGKGPGA